MANERKIGWQSRQTWKRFCAWYGADAVERKFGVQPPEDWCDCIEDLDEIALAKAMAQVREKFPTWMPSLPEFEQIIRDLRRAASAGDAPTLQEQLTTFVLRTKSLTSKQVREPWTFLGLGNARSGEAFAVTGVVIPPDGERCGYRVMVDDMRSLA